MVANVKVPVHLLEDVTVAVGVAVTVTGAEPPPVATETALVCFGGVDVEDVQAEFSAMQ